MNNIAYKNGKLFVENSGFEQLARKYGTPLYVYSKKAFIDSYRELKDNLGKLDNLICFSVKTCSNINIIKLLKEQGAGCDIVSGGELYRALKAGVAASKIVYAGVGKTAEEIEFALKSGIYMFNCESTPEIELINLIAGRLKCRPKLAIRVNPDVDAHTHSKITTGKKENKFGINIDSAVELYANFAKLPNIELCGIHCHIGSQITDIEPFAAALEKVLKLTDSLNAAGVKITTLNLGGGFGIKYTVDGHKLDLKKWGKLIRDKIKSRKLKLIIEPGRFIAGNSGTLLAKAVYIKETAVKKFIITDAAMNDLIRPTLYEAYHHILPVNQVKKTDVFDVVGPVCESGDYFAKDRKLGVIKANDYIAILSAGAYGFSMSSNYNSRPRPAEILVDGGKSKVIRARENYEDLIRLEERVK